MNKTTVKNRQQTVTLPKQEFIRLREQALAYRELMSRLFAMPLQDTIDEVVEDFRQTKLYTDEFLQDLESGLRKSSYAKKYAR